MVSRAARSTLDYVKGDNDWQTCNLERTLNYLCESSAPFKDLLLDVLRANGNRLRLVLYGDGITPGSALTSDNKRKSFVWYGSFLELGPLLCHEEIPPPYGLAIF